jgi:hypothetical protein
MLDPVPHLAQCREHERKPGLAGPIDWEAKRYTV